MSESASAPGSQVRSTSPRLMSSSARASPGSTRGARPARHTPDEQWSPPARAAGAPLDEPHARRAVDPLEQEPRLDEPAGPRAHVELVERGVIELLEAPTRGTHGGLPPGIGLVVGREPAVVDDC